MGFWYCLHYTAGQSQFPEPDKTNGKNYQKGVKLWAIPAGENDFDIKSAQINMRNKLHTQIVIDLNFNLC